ncbi:MAG: carbohydrate-binding domain-containing protein [Ruminococcus flavefaciens]|nr:carbohydrate-binding domain-containing protein [Ruminococcus flavefaciens]MCM1229164.1 carbohydrate-binding domain-containing protein [Ruminococcus flavefaciens]
MNYRKIFITAMSLLALTSCGKGSDTDITESSSQVTEAVTVTSTAETSAETASATTAETTQKKSAKTSSATTATEGTTSAKSAESTVATTKKTSADVKSTTAVKSSSGNNSSVTAKPQETAKSTSTAVTEPTTEAVTEPEKTYDAEFSLDETPVINITAGGDYIVRGYTAEGQIYIDTENEEKVEITLDGVDITCSDGPAILVNQAKRCVIKLADGSVNYLRDGGNDKVNDGVIFSNDTLRIKGKSGTLEINSGNAHGIASDDDVIIESGTYIINAVKTGITAHDDVTINGGDLRITGGTNGIKSKGTVNINGGNMYICGGSKDEKSSVYASAGFSYTGGYVYAVGNQVTPPSAPNPYVVVNYVNGAGAGSTVGLVLDGIETATVNPQSSFRCILMLSPDIYTGATFTAYLDGTASQDFTVADGQNVFEIE